MLCYSVPSLAKAIGLIAPIKYFIQQKMAKLEI